MVDTSYSLAPRISGGETYKQSTNHQPTSWTTMTSSADAESGVPTNKQTFVVWAPDCTDPDALSRRLAVRAEHLERVRRLTAEGLIS